MFCLVSPLFLHAFTYFIAGKNDLCCIYSGNAVPVTATNLVLSNRIALKLGGGGGGGGSGAQF